MSYKKQLMHKHFTGDGSNDGHVLVLLFVSVILFFQQGPGGIGQNAGNTSSLNNGNMMPSVIRENGEFLESRIGNNA
jgi:hypothetical protein